MKTEPKFQVDDVVKVIKSNAREYMNKLGVITEIDAFPINIYDDKLATYHRVKRTHYLVTFTNLLPMWCTHNELELAHITKDVKDAFEALLDL